MKYSLYHKSYQTMYIIGIAILITGLTFSRSMAESTLKIGVVDVKSVYNAWSEKTAADKELEPLRKKVDEKKKAFSDAAENYKIKGTAYNATTKAAEEKKLIEMQKDLETLYGDAMKQIDDKANALSLKLDGILQNAYKDFSKKEGYTIIIDIRSVRYFDPSAVTDITSKVTDYVNKASK